MLQQLARRVQPQARAADAAIGTLRREARYFAKLISKKLEQLNICYRYRKNEKDLIERGVKRVSFKTAVVQDEAIWFMIDTSPRKFPRGVSLSDINDEDVLNDLGVACARPVRFKQNLDGAWLVVERESGVFGIRSRIEFKEMMDAWPKGSKKELLVPLGLAHNRRLVYQSLDEFPHALIGGATKSGKTTLTHAWICALALHNEPELLKLILIDLKGGVEFTRYKTLPHIWEFEKGEGEDAQHYDGFVKDRNQVVPVLEILRWEMDRRLSMFESAGGIQNIAAWNYRHRRNPMPRIVCFIDELASLMLEPDLKKDAERCLADLGARGRAPGIHLVIATQRPEVSVVSGRIKGNLDARFGFRVPDNASSMVIMDDVSAAKFPGDTPRGRYMFKFGNVRREIQGAWVGPGKIRSIVNSILEGDPEMQVEAAKWDPEDIFRVALQEMNGDLSINKLYALLKGKGVSKRYIAKTCRDLEGDIVEVDEVLYEVRPGKSDFDPRRLVRVTGSQVSESDRDNDNVTGNGTQPGTQIVLAGTQGVDPGTLAEALGTQADDPLGDVLRYAVTVLGGELPIRALHDVFRGQITKNDLVGYLQELDNATVEVLGELYFVEPGAGTRPRRLIQTQANQ